MRRSALHQGQDHVFLLIELHFVHDPSLHFGNAGTAMGKIDV